MIATPTRDNTPRNAQPVMHPLDDFYNQAGLTLPPFQVVPGPELPEPHRSLLDHADDMTPTLERFHGTPIGLRVLRREQRGDYYHREVVLLGGAGNRPVEFGAIKISLGLFPPAARRDILEERAPLGGLLARHKLRHTSKPKAFFKVVPDAFIRESLGLADDAPLYGRRNTLFDPHHRPLAEIIEILPPEVVKLSPQDSETKEHL